MTPWLDAFVPAFGLLLLGAVLKRRLLRDDAVWAGMERLIFWVLLPSLIVTALSAVDLRALPLGRMALAIWGALAVGTAASLALARALGHGHAAMTSVVQGGIRFNNLMGFAICGALFGAPGLALAAVSTGLIVPVVQTVTVLVFLLGRGSGPRPRPLALLRQVLTNPLMLACVIGFALAMLGGLPPGLAPLVAALGRASVALGLLCVGAALSLGMLRAQAATQALTGALKLLGMPALTWGLATLLRLPPLETAVAVTFMALPTASTSYVMARAMGGDAPLMAAITTTEHAASAVTLPLWLALLAGVLAIAPP
ncbi:AEC family transporter [Caldovatus aquaticus]|uniref:AEC family transporter n=1 Tax=Caldovatus aquaticus TaxID=2865671 RepID=A0ABS7F3Q6_9PROT|nr:AEC family transporter [Caldovatus aquaticus]MBW8270251.1 AEC family transporter [Caldovatus aquaticus]